jgi:hypothetical protein
VSDLTQQPYNSLEIRGRGTPDVFRDRGAIAEAQAAAGDQLIAALYPKLFAAMKARRAKEAQVREWAGVVAGLRERLATLKNRLGNHSDSSYSDAGELRRQSQQLQSEHDEALQELEASVEELSEATRVAEELAMAQVQR